MNGRTVSQNSRKRVKSHQHFPHVFGNGGSGDTLLPIHLVSVTSTLGVIGSPPSRPPREAVTESENQQGSRYMDSSGTNVIHPNPEFPEN